MLQNIFIPFPKHLRINPRLFIYAPGSHPNPEDLLLIKHGNESHVEYTVGSIGKLKGQGPNGVNVFILLDNDNREIFNALSYVIIEENYL